MNYYSIPLLPDMSKGKQIKSSTMHVIIKQIVAYIETVTRNGYP